MKKTFKLFFIYLLLSNTISGQINFEKGNRTYRNGIIQYSGVTGGFIDINGDFYDDLVVLNKSKFLEVGYNQGVNNILNWMPPAKVNLSDEWSMVAGDFNNDGSSEIVIGGNFSGTKILKANQVGEYEISQSLLPLIYTQGANVIDFNNDGFLDYFGCHDEGNNLMLQNDKTGTLSPINLIDFNTIPISDNSGNYGSEWCDIDNDGDQDLYIAKCKFGIDDREDARRHNMLFINKGNGIFVNEAEARGLKIKGQSWTGSFADIDNDGDMDCVVTNHDEAHGFYENDGNGFFKPLTNLFLPKSFAFQSLWSDFDNDGWIDLLITGADTSYIYKNLEGKSFEKTINSLGTSILNAASLGDVNDDGFIDVNAIYGVNINNPSFVRDELFINKKNNNHFLKFALVGNTSNKMGIGAKLNLYGPWGKQSREVHSGVSYSISNSLTQIFGLGSNEKADSLFVNWPSGVVDKYYNIAADNLYFLQENKCINRRIEIESSKDFICKNESIPLTTPLSYQKYKWSNGSTNALIIVNKEGAYTLKATSADGCENFSKIKFISSTSTKKNYIYPEEDTIYFCKELTLNSVGDLSNIKWNGGLGVNITISESTVLNLTAKDLCGTEIEDRIIAQKVNTTIKTVNDTIAKGGTALLKAEGENVKWYSDVDKTNLVYVGNELTLVNVQKTTTFFVQANTTEGIKHYNLGETSLPVSSDSYPANNNDIGLYFNALEELTINSFDVASDAEGVRRFLLISYAGDTIGKKDVFIGKTNKQTVQVNFKVPPGTLYILKTDQDINLINLGYKAPRLKRVDQNTKYPYELYGLAEIPISFRGGQGYYYFFNIKLFDAGINCDGELQEVKAILDTEINTRDIENQIQIYPNPASSKLNVVTYQSVDMEIYNQFGVKVFNSKLESGNNFIDVSYFFEGLYFIKFKTASNVFERKIFIQN